MKIIDEEEHINAIYNNMHAFFYLDGNNIAQYEYVCIDNNVVCSYIFMYFSNNQSSQYTVGKKTIIPQCTDRWRNAALSAYKSWQRADSPAPLAPCNKARWQLLLRMLSNCKYCLLYYFIPGYPTQAELATRRPSYNTNLKRTRG